MQIQTPILKILMKEEIPECMNWLHKTEHGGFMMNK